MYSKTRLTENISKPKELQKSLNSLGLNFEKSVSSKNCLENDTSPNFDIKDIAGDFSLYVSISTDNLLNKLSNPSNNIIYFQ